jgi:hypothetical protein
MVQQRCTRFLLKVGADCTVERCFDGDHGEGDEALVAPPWDEGERLVPYMMEWDTWVSTGTNNDGRVATWAEHWAQLGPSSSQKHGLRKTVKLSTPLPVLLWCPLMTVLQMRGSSRL